MSVHTCGEGTPSQVWVGGYPILGLGRRVPHPRSQWGYPIPGPDGGYPIPGEVPHPRSGWGYPILLTGVPHPRSEQEGVPPPFKTGWVTPPPPIQDWMGYPPIQDWMGYPSIQDWMGYHQPQSAKQALATRRMVCLLRSRRRTFLFAVWLDNFANGVFGVDKLFGNWNDNYKCPFGEGSYQLVYSESDTITNQCSGDSTSYATVSGNAFTIKSCSSASTYRKF